MTQTELAAVDRRKWLFRLIYVRIFGFCLHPDPLVQRQVQNPHDMVLLLGTVFTLSVCWFAPPSHKSSYTAQSYAQIILDLLLITWIVNRTGGVDSYVSNLYFLEIVMSSILLERQGAFLAATLSSVIHLAHLDLAKYGVLPSVGSGGPDWPELQFIISVNILRLLRGSLPFELSGREAASRGRPTREVVRPDGVPAGFQSRIIDSMDVGSLRRIGAVVFIY